MDESQKKLQLNRDRESQSVEISSKNEIAQIKRNIEGIEKNISDLESRRSHDLENLAKEKNYDIFFYIGGFLVLLNLVFKFSLIGLFIAFFFALLFGIYKMFFSKKQRAKRLNDEVNREIAELGDRLEERQEDIRRIENKFS